MVQLYTIIYKMSIKNILKTVLGDVPHKWVTEAIEKKKAKHDGKSFQGTLKYFPVDYSQKLRNARG